MSPLRAVYALWTVWYATWLASAVWAASPSARPPSFVHLPYQIVTLAAIAFLFASPSIGVPLLWTLDENAAWACFGAVVSAFAFCWWARIEMGSLWSGFKSRTPEHRIVDSGPFALVRHPIYFGIVVAAFATAAIKATGQAFLGAALFLFAFWLKASIEESFLRDQLGPDLYDAYRKRVPMLIPFRFRRR